MAFGWIGIKKKERKVKRGFENGKRKSKEQNGWSRYIDFCSDLFIGGRGKEGKGALFYSTTLIYFKTEA